MNRDEVSSCNMNTKEHDIMTNDENDDKYLLQVGT
jgi:hypothetical protein